MSNPLHICIGQLNGNALKKMLELQKSESFPAGGVSDISFVHDDWCRFLAKRGDCNCNPDIRIVRPA